MLKGMAKTTSHHLLSLLLLLLNLLLQPTASELCFEPQCEFTLDIRWARTMTYRDPKTGTVYNVAPKHGKHLVIIDNVVGVSDPALDPRIGETVNASEVITGDGSKRNVISINGKFPGPTLEVMEGAEVLVHVQNHLDTDALTVHWHGMHQRGSSWHDGAAYVTQCPIVPGAAFTYRFRASPGGAHWYHSHVLNQRDDGLYGAFIVHRHGLNVPGSTAGSETETDSTKTTESNTQSYSKSSSFDAPIHFPMMVSELYHLEARTIRILNAGVDEMARHSAHASGSHHMVLDSQVHNVLVNGRGRGTNGDSALPLTTYTINPDHRRDYRFSSIHSGADFSYRITIDGHRLRILALDGFEIVPIVVDVMYIYPGETIEYEIIKETTDEEETLFWIRHEEAMLHASPPGHEHMMDMGTKMMEEDEGHHHHHHEDNEDDEDEATTKKDYLLKIHPTHLTSHNGSTGAAHDGHSMMKHEKRSIKEDRIRNKRSSVEDGVRNKRSTGEDRIRNKRSTGGDSIRKKRSTGEDSIRKKRSNGKDTLRTKRDTEDTGSNQMAMSEGLAILQYTTKHSHETPTATHVNPKTSRRICTKFKQCVVFNCPGGTGRSNEKCKLFDTIHGSKSTNEELWSKLKLDEPADHEYVLNFILSGKPGATGSSINGKKFELPRAPMWEISKQDLQECSEAQNNTRCTHILDLPPNKVVDLLFSNFQGPEQSIYAHHPVHLHGHSFAVLAVAYPTWHEMKAKVDGGGNGDSMDFSTMAGGMWHEAEGIMCQDTYCDSVIRTHLHDSKRRKRSSPRKRRRHVPELETVSPIIKDTIIVPARGYVIVRILTDNPGHWFLHCHVDQHLIDGMGMLVHVPPDLPIPQNFPRCYSSGATTYLGFDTPAAAGMTEHTAANTWLVPTLSALTALLVGIVIGIAGLYIVRRRSEASARL